MEDLETNKISTSKHSIKSSPNYDQQVEEIEILKNIIPEKIEVLKEEPNFILKIEIVGNNIEEPKKKFILEINLIYNYPEKLPRYRIYEINNYLSDKRKSIIEERLAHFCEENIGFPIIYQLYEICQEFADEEEKIELLKEEAKKEGMIPYNLNNLNKIRQIKETPVDIIVLKTGNILVINEDVKIKIYDNKLETILFEQLKSDYYSDYPITFCKYFPSSEKKEPDFLYLFNCNDVYIYIIKYFNKKQVIEKDYLYKINGNIKIQYLYQLLSISDVIEFSECKNSIIFLEKEETDYLLTKYNKIKNKDEKLSIKYEKKIIRNKHKKVYRKLYKINSDKFIISSYTLKYKEGDKFKIEGINKMSFVHRNDFSIHKSYNIKISPLNNSISNYKEKYILVSFFNIIKKKEENDKKKDEKETQYDFEDSTYNEIFHNHFIYERNDDLYYDDYYYDDEDLYRKINTYNNYNNKYYSYDITEHLIGIFSIKKEELVTIIEIDLTKNIYNINNYLLCLFSKNHQNKKKQQISTERVFHHYFNEIPLKESEFSFKYEKENYLAFLFFDEGCYKIDEILVDYSNISAFVEVDKGYLAIGSKKKGLILYNKKK